jgi:hypothetical protein
MRATRGVSNVVFSFLPDQTADLGGRIWRVDRWNEPTVLNIDVASVRSELERVTMPWTVADKDNGLSERLRGGTLQVVSPSEHGGVRVAPFPSNWRCAACGRLEDRNDRACRCGATSEWRQLPFVAYHHCGLLETPFVPRCPTHKQVRVALPDSSSTSDMHLICPVCSRDLNPQGGFPFRRCVCGEGVISYNVHRAAVVFSPHSLVVVNPPTPEIASALRSTAGAQRTLEWVLDGLVEADPNAGRPSQESVIAGLMTQGLDEATARKAAEAIAADLPETQGADATSGIGPAHLEAARAAALSLAFATGGGRVRADDLAVQLPRQAPVYEVAYPSAMAEAGLAEVELLPDFPVLNAVYGFTRGGGAPTEKTLRWFRGPSGEVRLHGQLSHTEGLLFRLDPLRTARWLLGMGHRGLDTGGGVAARASILSGAVIPSPGQDIVEATLGSDLLKLVHSYAHRVMRRISAFAGIDRDSLSEYLIPLHLAFVIYATGRGDFVLGGLQALFESDLVECLRDLQYGEHRCALDPGCGAAGGACVACLHVGEPSCRYFNGFLDRRTLFGPRGFFRA